jgi:biotin transporter BioY
MKDDLRLWLAEVAGHPITFGIVAGLARWAIGDRAGGIKAVFGYLCASLLVAWAGAFYLADEGLTPPRTAFYLLLLAFVAKDILVALAGLAQQFRVDPLAMLARLHKALRGGSDR